MVKGIGTFELLAKQLQRERNLQDASLSTSKFGRKVAIAIAVADEHQKIPKVPIQSKANSLAHSCASFIADLMKPLP